MTSMFTAALSSHSEATGTRFYHFGNAVCRRIVAPLLRVNLTMHGQENVPMTGPVLVITNHMSNFDPPFLGMTFPRPLTMMSKSENFTGNPVKRWIVVNYGAFPIRRGEADIGAIKYALGVLKRGNVLYMAPEGTRSTVGHMIDPQEGSALLAVRSGAPIVPVGVYGQERFRDNLKRWGRTDVTLAIGPPFHLVMPEGRPSRATLIALADAMMARLTKQLPPPYWGRFTPQMADELTVDVTTN